jgi:hypothetical protein
MTCSVSPGTGATYNRCYPGIFHIIDRRITLIRLAGWRPQARLFMLLDDDLWTGLVALKMAVRPVCPSLAGAIAGGGPG